MWGFKSSAVIGCLVSVGMTGTAVAEIDRPKAAIIPEYGYTLAPLAFVKFCLENAPQCDARDADGAKPGTVSELRAVNAAVNRGIAPVRKPTEPLRVRWTVEATRGDCNDYAVTKRHRLISAGWPPSTLRLSVAVTQEGVGHLVLIARTDRGDMVLDNLTDEVKEWSNVPYEWVSMQSGENPRFWIAIGERGREMRRRLERVAVGQV